MEAWQFRVTWSTNYTATLQKVTTVFSIHSFSCLSDETAGAIVAAGYDLQKPQQCLQHQFSKYLLTALKALPNQTHFLRLPYSFGGTSHADFLSQDYETELRPICLQTDTAVAQIPMSQFSVTENNPLPLGKIGAEF